MSSEPIAPARTAQKVFVCYRREGSAAHAGRVYDAMVARFGERNVFMDVDMEPGVDFVERITEVVSGCVALIAVIDPTWATVTDEDGTRRIDDPDDFVRLEIETALSHGAKVIPLLVHGARMPRREDLPAQLQPLARRNALEMSDGRWSYDVGRLLTALDETISDELRAQLTTPEETSDGDAREQPRPAPRSWRLVVEGALVGGLTAAIVRAPLWAIGAEGDTTERIGVVVARQAGVGALTGLALAIWLTLRLARSDLPLLRGLLLGLVGGALGGAILGYLVFHPSPPLTPDETLKVALLSVPVTGAFLGALIGSLWRPPRIAAALVAGAAGGFLFELFANAISMNNENHAWVDVHFGLTAAAITAAAVAVMIAVDRKEASVGSAGPGLK